MYAQLFASATLRFLPAMPHDIDAIFDGLHEAR